MEFKISVHELQQIFNKLNGIVKPSEDTVIGMVCIEATDKLLFKATNGVLSIIIESETANIIEQGTILFKFRDLKGYISKFTAYNETIGTKEFHFIINRAGLIKAKTFFEGGKSSYRKLHFDIYNSNMFPLIKIVKQADLVLNSSILKDGIIKTLNLVNPMEMRKALSSLYIKIYNDKIIFVGADGVRLAEYIISLQTTMSERIVLFSYSLANILRNLLDLDQQVFIKFGSKYAYFKFDKIFLVGSLIINEEYPDYKQILYNIDKEYKFPRSAVYDTIKTISDTFNAEDDNRIIFKFNGNKLIVANERVETEHELDYTINEEIIFAVNGVLLESVLQYFMYDVIDICMNNDLKFIVFKSENENYSTLISTLRMI